MGYETTQGRYGAIIMGGLVFCHRWNQEGYWATTTATELSMLTKKAFPKLKLQDTGAALDSNEDSTSRKVVSTGDRTLKTCGINAIAIKACLLSDDSHFRILAGTTSLGEVVIDWCVNLKQQCKTVEGNQRWLRDQLDGGITEHAKAIFDMFTNEK